MPATRRTALVGGDVEAATQLGGELITSNVDVRQRAALGQRADGEAVADGKKAWVVGGWGGWVGGWVVWGEGGAPLVFAGVRRRREAGLGGRAGPGGGAARWRSSAAARAGQRPTHLSVPQRAPDAGAPPPLKPPPLPSSRPNGHCAATGRQSAAQASSSSAAAPGWRTRIAPRGRGRSVAAISMRARSRWMALGYRPLWGEATPSAAASTGSTRRSPAGRR
jgi:hypothetical protein